MREVQFRVGMNTTLLTINTWKCDGDYYPRMELLAAGLKASGAHIILCQECFRTADGKVDTLSYLSRELSMPGYFVPCRRKTRLLGGIPTDSFSGLGVLTNLPVISQMTIDLPSSPADGGRSAQLLTLNLGAGLSLMIANIHLTHLRNSEALRLSQLEKVLTCMAGSEASYHIIGGDFNARPGSEPIEFLKNKINAVECIQHFVDYIFVLPSTIAATYPSTIHAKIVLDNPDAAGRYPSDHFGLQATLSLTKTSRPDQITYR
jgi:endonuclease/exonuclease/phosphatase family metal-dependent hydrolase